MRHLVGFLFFLSASLLSMRAESVFRHLGVTEGLPNSFVTDLAIDNQGMIWVSSEKGIARIAGDNIETWNTRNSNLLDDKIISLYFDRNSNSLWCQTLKKGFSILDCNTFSFSVFDQSCGLLSNNLNAVSSAQDGGLWIMTDDAGIQYYNPKTGVSRIYSPADYPGLDASIRCCAEDRNGKLYIGSRHGFVMLDPENRTVKKYCHDAGNPQSLPGDLVRSILIDSGGNVWVGTNQGLGLFDRISGKFLGFRHENDNPNSLAGNNIFSLTELSGRQICVSSDLGGISVLDPEHRDRGFSRITDEEGLTSINVRCVVQDNSGNIWVANYGSGVDFITDNVSPLNILPYYGLTHDRQRLKRIYAICSDEDGNLWLGGENELSLFRNNKYICSWDLSPFLLQTYTVPYVLYPDKSGNIWIGLNDEGVLAFNPKTGQFRRISSASQLLDVHAMYEDVDGRMWIGTEAGLYCVDDKGVMHQQDQFRRGELNLCIYGLQQDELGRLWVGSLGNGLFVFGPDGMPLAEFNEGNGFCSNNINQIFKDHNGCFWIATYAGLVCFPDPSNLERMEVFNSKNGLKNENVRAIQEDAMGGIWISTYNGIASLSRRDGVFEIYNDFNGEPIGSFVESSSARGQGNTLYFGSPEGVCFFDPMQMSSSEKISRLHFVSFWKSGVGDNGWTPIQMDAEQERLTLRYDENMLRMAFAVEDYSQLGRVEYSYKLTGIIDDWISNGSRGQLDLWGLKPGNHRFQLRVRFQDQAWEEGLTRSILIRVRPPVWGSLLAKILYGLLFATILFFFFRYVHLRLSLQMEKENRQKEQDLHEERMRFFTNITHELRTPLTLILGPLEDLVNDKNLPEPYSGRIAGIHKSGMRLHSLINQILEFRETQTQTKKLVVRQGDLGKLVENIGMRWKELNRNAAVEIQLDISDCGKKIYFDPDIVSTILENLMSNAVKNTLRGSIILSLYSEEIDGEHYCTMSVKDTGYGIPEADQSMIFNRYYQVKGVHQTSGTGIGLALVKALSEVHEGVLRVSSREGKGSTFFFSILRDEIYPQASAEDATIDEATADTEPGKHIAPGVELPVALVIEDDEDILKYISDSLSDSYSVFQARDGKIGWEKALKRIPDIIVSDIMMPELDGIELCRRLKSDIRTSHIPVILLTAKDTLQDKEAGYESGADSYLTKPFTSRLLRSRIENLLESRRLLARRLLGNLHESGSSQGIERVIGSLNDCDREFITGFDQLINDNMDKEDLDMDFITAHFNMSYSTFYRKVRGLTGVTAKEYIRTRKMSRAMDLLRTGKYNVNEVSMMTGYQDAGNFRNYFRKEFGMNPSDVLRSIRS